MLPETHNRHSRRREGIPETNALVAYTVVDEVFLCEKLPKIACFRTPVTESCNAMQQAERQ